MTNSAAVAHDTDPAPSGNDGGNGRDTRYPCAIHAAQLVETRDVLVEVRDLAGSISTRLGDEIANRAKRDDDIEEAIVLLTAEVQTLTTVVGTAPDVSTGATGTGMRGQVALAVNAALRAGARREMPSLVDADYESEVTGIQDRTTLLTRARAAEHAESKLKHRLLLAAIGLGVTTVTTIGTVLVAWLTGG